MNSRLIAAQVLHLVINDGKSLTVALQTALPEMVSSQDQAFIKALSFGVMRQYQRLDYILGLLSHKPIKDVDVRILILLGLYQIKYTRVKPHAAVSETVSVLRKKPRAKPLVNAVLRTYLRKQDELEQRADEFTVAALVHPEWMIQKIRNSWPDQSLQIMSENNLQAPMILRVNLSRLSREDYLKQLDENEIDAGISSVSPAAIILNQAVVVERLPGFKQGLVSVQDTAAQLAADLLDVEPGQRVLDVCAAPGGKTAHILEAQPELARLIAVDIDASRLERVQENLTRLQLSSGLIRGDAADPGQWWDGSKFDRILLDAPCSALGVIRRHPDIKFLRREDDLPALQKLQKKILNSVWELLTPGGILLYATCSILKEENELQIRSFLAEKQDAETVTIDADWGLMQEYGRQILPGEEEMDGFYYAKIRKN